MKSQISNLKSQKAGFTLVETLVALSVLIFAVTGPLTLASFAIRSSGYSQNQIIAFYLAQEALEYVKNKRDNNALSGANWLSGMTSCRSANGCAVDAQNDDIEVCPSQCPKIKYDSATGFYNQQNGSDTIFSRKVKLDKISNYEEKVTITLSWQERLIPRSFSIEENIFDWP